MAVTSLRSSVACALHFPWPQLAAADSALPGFAEHLLDGDAAACDGTVGAQPDSWRDTAGAWTASRLSWCALRTPQQECFVQKAV